MSVASQQDNQINIRQLVEWLGTDGAKAGLMQSKNCTVDTLSSIAKSLGLAITRSTTKAKLVDDIIRVASTRIDKPVEELYTMSREDLIDYFLTIEVKSEELLDLLRKLELKPRRDGHKALIELAAGELSETGRFRRIASSGGSNNDNTLKF